MIKSCFDFEKECFSSWFKNSKFSTGSLFSEKLETKLGFQSSWRYFFVANFLLLYKAFYLIHSQSEQFTCYCFKE